MHPHFADLDPRLIILSQTEATDGLTCVVTSDSKTGRCPKCRHVSHKRHGILSKVFTERFEWLLPHGQRTVRLDAALRIIAFSTNCVEAAKVTRSLGMPVSHDTLLRLIQTTEMPTVHSPFCRH